ncbi:MAG TPA: alpha/beta fold hydrolase [Symbiobacteriaceae bacterium]|jgi:pimeloyl-ACP methyl ester carboxylesterase
MTHEALQSPVGYYHLHDDVSLNFQMNRSVSWMGDSALADLRRVAPAIQNYADWKREFLALSEEALAGGQTLKGAFYLRSAEFFMPAGDPDKAPAYRRFLALVAEAYGSRLYERDQVPYEGGFLPILRFRAAASRGTVVTFGGFDSYIEEFVPILAALRDRGYDVIAFEGPGQGGALELHRMPMTLDWHRPVAAVLDYYGLDDVTLVGISLGGCLALRAAAFEPRVRRVVAFDVLADFLDTALKMLGPVQRALLRLALRLRATGLVKAAARRAMRESPVIEWGIQQGMHVFGAASPYEFFQKAAGFQTANVSPLVKQHVLLMAGSRDHFIPLSQFHQQMQMLTGAASVTGRIFTEAEQAQNHCQVGNMGLAVDFIANWITFQLDHPTENQGE